MAVTAGAAAQVLLDGFNMHQFARSFSVNPTIDIHDASVLGTTSRIKVAGIKHATATGEFFVDDTATIGSYIVLKNKYGSAEGILSFAPQGFALGNRTLLMYLHQVSFAINAVVDDLEMITFNAEAAEDSADAGVSLHALTAETSFSFNGTAVDNTAATTNGGVGTVHCTAIAGASPSIAVKIQHSTDSAAWVDLITWTAPNITAANQAKRTEVTGTVNRYLRCQFIEGGTTTSITAVVAFARR